VPRPSSRPMGRGRSSSRTRTLAIPTGSRRRATRVGGSGSAGSTRLRRLTGPRPRS
jgi:hypothetical protein